MSQVAGADWTDEHTAQWSAAYGAITSRMLEGAHARLTADAVVA